MRKVLLAALAAATLLISGGAAAAGSLNPLADGASLAAYGPVQLDAATLETIAPTLAFAASAPSSPNTLLGAAVANSDGSILLDSTKAPFSGLSFSVPRYLSVGDITDFSLDYDFGGSCAAGSPQLVIVTLRGPIYVSMGQSANFSCASGPRNSSSFLHFGTPVNTGNIVGPSGTFTDTWGHAKSEYDRLGVTGIMLVTAAPNQSVVVANAQLILNLRVEEPSL